MPTAVSDNPYQPKPHRASLRLRAELGDRGRVDEDEEGNLVLVCADGTRRPPERNGLEGALDAACQQAKVSLVPVLLPCIPKRYEAGTPRHLEEFERRVDCIYYGENLRGDPLPVKVAERTYFRRSVDVCERTKKINPA